MFKKSLQIILTGVNEIPLHTHANNYGKFFQVDESKLGMQFLKMMIHEWEGWLCSLCNSKLYVMKLQKI